MFVAGARAPVWEPDQHKLTSGTTETVTGPKARGLGPVNPRKSHPSPGAPGHGCTLEQRSLKFPDLLRKFWGLLRRGARQLSDRRRLSRPENNRPLLPTPPTPTSWMRPALVAMLSFMRLSSCQYRARITRCQEVVAHIANTAAVFAIDTEYNTVDKINEMGVFRFLDMEGLTMIMDDQGPRNFGNKRHLSSVF